MNYTVSTADASYNSLEHLYTAPVKSVGRKIRAAALAFVIIVSPLNSDAYGAEHCLDNVSQHTIEWMKESGQLFFANAQLTDIHVKLDQLVFKLLARRVSEKWQRQESIDKLRESFYANFNESQIDIDCFTPMFKSIAEELSVLKINYSFVDVSRKKGMIDLNLELEEGVFLSVAKYIKEQSDDVLFTIARNHRTIVIDEMPLQELVGKVNNVIAQLKNVGHS